MAGELKALISDEFVTELGKQIHSVDTQFKCSYFVSTVLDSSWEMLELKARLNRIAVVLGESFDNDYCHAIDVLLQICHDYDGLQSLVFPEFVEQFGLDDWEVSMKALEVFTSYSSAEFAVRPFIRQDQDLMMSQMLAWSKSSNLHHRRLASEGCRPRLPWASPLRRFIVNPEPILPVLESLKNDSEEYVRRSVANNLNDISKDHPEVALGVAASWSGENETIGKIIKHGLRTLLKQGNERALALFGYGNPSDIAIKYLGFSGELPRIGCTSLFQFDLNVGGKAATMVRVEFALYYRKANGKLSRKVFQLAEKKLNPGVYSLSKKHSFRQMTTRKHYPGSHELAIHVNGRELAKIEFELLPE